MNTQQDLHVDVLNPGVLTKAEARILKFICMGWAKKRIAAWVHRSYKTIDGTDENIRKKLGARSNNEVIAIAVADGMVKISRASKTLCLILAIIVPIMTILTDDARAGRVRVRMPRPVATRARLY